MTKRYLNSQCRNGVVYKYSAEWTRRLESLQHWEFYWFQQKLMEGLSRNEKDESILEIGVGSGFAANYCRSKGFHVSTLDIDPEKKPDIVANAVDFDFQEKYDHLMAFEIMEHMPYQEFEKIVRKIPLFIKRYAFISLPRNEISLFNFNLKIPRLPVLNWDWRILSGKIRTEAHHWELDHGNTTTERVESLFDDVGLKIEKQLAHRYIRFYALQVD
ncbi:MAG: methyltransferase domain-containing protein [Thiocapsa sp.]|uniref:methyltransferase domain-containing protein n=1 Tax=Thiocapsa sp. TaxID=2024551 RepID=UPI001BCE03D3|nr:methyltransferase domain-containing protein [Thiocapsa sp.]QVL49809.1 MAG: methyltransferase domain-containing protein [Thiocapsa sp.]